MEEQEVSANTRQGSIVGKSPGRIRLPETEGEVKPRTKFKMKETKQSKMNKDYPPKTKSELETHPEDSTARQAKNRNETKETTVGRGIEPATGREERTVGDRKRQRN